MTLIKTEVTITNSAGDSGSPWRTPDWGITSTPCTIPFPTTNKKGERRRDMIRDMRGRGMPTNRK
jgi:hypothetical protein